MKKENKELARKNKSKKRRQDKIKKNLILALKIGIPVLLLILIISLCILKPTPSNEVTEVSQPSSYTVDTSYAVQMGDSLNIDFAGYIDGTAFDGGTASGYTLEIGSGTFIDDFEEQLIGTHPGETVDVDVTFPANYDNPSLAGKDATFKVTVNGVYE